MSNEILQKQGSRKAGVQENRYRELAMERVDRILQDPVFQQEMTEIAALEQDRIFCGHGMEHLLDTARLTYIFALEQQIEIEKEQIYAAALLHDIGRGIEYRQGIPHHLAGIALAGEILMRSGFTTEEQAQILQAIGSHRSGNEVQHTVLGELLYQADKLSRNCFSCSVSDLCNWPKEKKNEKIRY